MVTEDITYPTAEAKAPVEIDRMLAAPRRALRPANMMASLDMARQVHNVRASLLTFGSKCERR
jgi:hypothetical protein